MHLFLVHEAIDHLKDVIFVEKIRQMLMEGKITNAASIVALYRALHHRSGQ